MQHYRSSDEDSGRWSHVPLRAGDIIVCTRSKHGTTWVQAILLSLLHGTDLPDRLDALSPWVDHLVEPIGEVAARLAAQTHRRVLKTHTPPDGVPRHPQAHLVVVARDPLDAALSLYHQGANIDRARLAELTGGSPRPNAAERPPAAEWLARWVEDDADPIAELDSLPGVMRHLALAWARRDEPQVVLVRYADLLGDPASGIAALSRRLDIPPAAPPEAVVAATTLPAMRARASDLLPDSRGVLADPVAFFRRGRLGEGAEVAGSDVAAACRRRMARLAPPELVAWLTA